ncbi:MAG: DUF2332 domain-containing protein [Xanthobacteraceae bacterium]
MDDPRKGLQARYRRFAKEGAHGRSPLYETISLGVADDLEIIEFLLALPPQKQQPNLLLGTVRHLFGAPTDWVQFRQTLMAHADEVRAFMFTHATQTNEPARCAVLLPLLARLPQPLALLEVGTSAGLCLLPDFYAYDYGTQRLRSSKANETAPVFTCRAGGTTPLPTHMPEIIWRAGLDRNPIDVADRAQTDWLESLIWPEQTERLMRLKSALEIAEQHRPRIAKGDLLGEDFEALCRDAPKEATLVVFHTSVLSYIADHAQQQEFGRRAMSAANFWISNEQQQVLPELTTGIVKTDIPGRFLMALNGEPVAWTDQHGAAMEWISAAPGAAFSNG